MQYLMRNIVKYLKDNCDFGTNGLFFILKIIFLFELQ